MLFVTAFSAATVLPVSSEAGFYLFMTHGLNPWFLLLAAGSGNTMGAILNYWIGIRGSDWLLEHRKISKKSLEYSKNIFDRWGGLSLLLSWMPLIGDPLTLVAGVLHYDPKKFILVVASVKFARYAFIIMIV
jgi:membrane protein YqaA with SNARE-associated domain